MTPVARLYPAELQEAVTHAERFCQALSRLHEVGAEPRSERARVWLVGRTDEVEKVLSCVVADWREGRVGEAVAARSVREYLGDLHVAVRGLVEGEPAWGCCSGDDVVTLPMRLPGDPTRFPPPPSASPHDTVADGGMPRHDDGGVPVEEPHA
jgi:hypothetical protein